VTLVASVSISESTLIDLGIKYDPSTGIYGLDFCVVQVTCWKSSESYKRGCNEMVPGQI